MTETYKRLIDSGGGYTEPAERLMSVSIANPGVDLGSKITSHKVWHATCRKPDVSKILDWLVI